MIKHVIKMTHDDGKKLINPTLWCGRVKNPHTWAFVDAGHVSLSIGGSARPCKSCIRAIIKELKKELDDG